MSGVLACYKAIMDAQLLWSGKLDEYYKPLCSSPDPVCNLINQLSLGMCQEALLKP